MAVTWKKLAFDADLLGLPAMSDPGADRIVFWDDSESALKWLTPNDMLSITTTNLNVAYKDEDNMASDSDAHLATQQSIKAYVDAVGGIPFATAAVLGTL